MKKGRGGWAKAGERGRGLIKVKRLDFVLRAIGSRGGDLSRRVSRADVLFTEITLTFML